MAMAPAKPSERAAERSDRDFVQLAEPLRRELKVHCYRMLGSLHEAEDAVQEAYLRAWRSFASFDGRGSFRAWLYRIATNVCLDALSGRGHERRFLPDQRAPATSEMPDGRPASDVEWLEPYPDADLEGIADDAPNPEARYTSRQAVQLAFVAVIQQLPPRQRAVLLLRDVLGWSAAEVATLLGGSTASVNSVLQRSRETLARQHAAGRPPADAPTDPGQKKLLERYVQAWEALELEDFVALERRRHVHHAAPAAMVCRTCGDPRFLCLFLQALWRLPPAANGGQPAACLRRLFAPRDGRTLERAFAARARARAGRYFQADAFCQAHGAGVVCGIRAAAHDRTVVACPLRVATKRQIMAADPR